MSRILIVDDDAAITAMLIEFFESLGHRGIAVHTGDQALALAHRYRPDAIVLDLMLPGMTGAETAVHLRRNPDTSSIPIVAISSLEYVEDLGDVLMVDDILAKPFDLEELNQRLTVMLRRPEAVQPEDEMSASSVTG